MPVSGKVLVDTSVWIAFFRKSDPCHSTVLHLLSEDLVCSAGIIVAELIQGAKSGKELTVLKDFIHTFQFLPESPSIWETAGELSYRLRRKGISVGLADCFIAIAARESNVRIFTLDTHFERLKEEAGIKLFS